MAWEISAGGGLEAEPRAGRERSEKRGGAGSGVN